MKQYPEDQQEFNALIASDAACRAYLTRIRWPDGFSCPACAHTISWRLSNDRWECRACHHQTSLTSGTLFQDTRFPLAVWFQVIWYITGQKYGTSALGLQRLMGFGSYHTAWAWLHRLRRAMVRPGRDDLHGVVQVDETYWGGERTGKRGRGAEGKTLILIAIEHTGRKLGRLRLQRIPDASGKTLISVVQALVAPGSIVETDGWRGYCGLASEGYQPHVLRAEATEELLPQVHLIVALLKRWLLGTHQGGIHETHLDYYLDEYTFRFNRRTSHSRGLLFRRVLEYAVLVTPLREADLRASAQNNETLPVVST